MTPTEKIETVCHFMTPCDITRVVHRLISASFKVTNETETGFALSSTCGSPNLGFKITSTAALKVKVYENFIFF